MVRFVCVVCFVYACGISRLFFWYVPSMPCYAVAVLNVCCHSSRVSKLYEARFDHARGMFRNYRIIVLTVVVAFFNRARCMFRPPSM